MAVKVSLGENESYRLEWIEPLGADIESPTRRLRELGGPGTSVFQLLPNEEVSLLITALPAMKRKQMVAALQGVLHREKGGQQEEWVVDYLPLPERVQAGPRKLRSDLSALFVRRIVLEHQYGLAKGLGIRPKGLLPGYLALDQLYRRHHPVTSDDEVWNLVYLGQDDKFLCVADEHCLLFTRPLPADLSGGVAQGEYVERLAAEVERSNFFAQQAERSMQVQRIVVCGDPDLAPALVEKLAEMSDFEVQNWRAEELFAIDDDTVVWEHLIPLAAAVAALFAPVYNLLPQEVQEKKQRVARRYAVAATGAFGAAVVPILLLGGLWTTHIQSLYLSEAREQIEEGERRVEEAATSYLHDRVLRSRQESVDRYSRELPDFAGLLRDIAVRTPATVVYSTLDVREETAGVYRLILQGESIAKDGTRAHETFLEFLVALTDCRRIREIKEPTYLEISGAGEDGPPHSRVLFTLEYEILSGGET